MIQPTVEKEWTEKGYLADEGLYGYSVTSSLVISYVLTPVNYKSEAGRLGTQMNRFEIFAGAELDLSKHYLGPVGGFFLNKYRFSLTAMGCFPVYCEFKQKGYDPNSWYRIFITYKVKDWNVGAASIRSYATGLLLEYKPPSERFGRIQLIAGRDFEFKRNAIVVSFVMSIEN